MQPGNKQQNTNNSQIVNEIYEKVQKVWNYQYEQQAVKSMTIAHIKQIVTQANLQNPQACFLLGRCYDRGYGFLKNQKFARQWHFKAEKLGQMHSSYNLYLSDKSDKQKQQHLNNGLQKGQFRSIYQMAVNCFKHEGEDKKQKIIFGQKLMHRLFNQNYVEAHYLAWLAYSKKTNQLYDWSKALHHLQIYAKKTQPESTWEIYYGGQLEKLEMHQQAIQVLENAYKNIKITSNQEKGHVCHLVGICYKALNKTEKVREWFKKGIGWSYLRSFNQLAIIYYKQEMYEQAKQALLKAIKIGNNQKNDLAVVYQNIGKCYERQNNYEEAYKYYHKSASLVHWLSQAECGWMLYHGRGVNKDQPKGIQLLQQSKNYGDSVAQKYLKSIKK